MPVDQFKQIEKTLDEIVSLSAVYQVMLAPYLTTEAVRAFSPLQVAKLRAGMSDVRNSLGIDAKDGAHGILNGAQLLYLDKAGTESERINIGGQWWQVRKAESTYRVVKPEKLLELGIKQRIIDLATDTKITPYAEMRRVKSGETKG